MRRPFSRSRRPNAFDTARVERNEFGTMTTEPAQPAQPAHAEPEEKFTTPRSLLVDAILAVAFFVFMFNVIRPHVPTESTLYLILLGGGATACLTGVFWLAVQMFRVVLRAQLAEKRGK